MTESVPPEAACGRPAAGGLRRETAAAVRLRLEAAAGSLPVPEGPHHQALEARLHVGSALLAAADEGAFSGSGVAAEATDAEGSAWLEALERWHGALARGRGPTVRSGRIALGEPSLDPASAVLHAPEDYGDPRNRCAPYDDRLSLDWVAGHAFTLAPPGGLTVGRILAPAQLAYYRHSDPGSGGRFVYDSSNGCAIGTGLAEATLYGLLEVIERDAELAWWASGLSPPRIAPSVFGAVELAPLVAMATRRGFEVAMHDISDGWRMPVIQTVLRRPCGSGAWVASAAAAARPLAVQAAVHALKEALAAACTRSPLTSAERRRAERLAEDPDAVARPDDHRLYFSTRAGMEALDPLFASEAASDLPPSVGRLTARGVLRGALADAAARHGQAVVVDQTSEGLRAAGLSAVKVLVPGALPPTFGQQYRRMTEDRLDALASRQGLIRGAPRRSPHPFL